MMMKKIIDIIFPPVDCRCCPLVRNSHRMRQSPGALRRVCGFIHQAPGTDRASRPAAACAEGKASEKKKEEKKP